MDPNATPATPATPAAPPAAEHMIPKGRFDEVNEARKAAELLVAEFKQKEEAARQEQLKAAGKFGEVETELRTKLEAAEAEKTRLAGIAEQFEAQQKATREATIATLPEAQREYAASLPADKLPGFVAAIGGRPTTPPLRPGEPGTPPTVPPGRATPDEIARGVREFGTQWLKDNAARIA